MRTEIETYELIEKYLNGKLSGEELIKIENLIRTDQEFATEVQNHKQLTEFLFNRSMVDIKDQIKSIHKRNLSSPGQRFLRGRFFSILGILTIAGIIMISVFINEKTHQQPLKLSNTYIDTIQKPSSIKVVNFVPKETSSNQENTVIKELVTPEKNLTDSHPVKNQIVDTKITTNDIHQNSIDQDPTKFIAEPKTANLFGVSEEVIETTTPVIETSIPQSGGDPCESVIITATVESSESCGHKPTGSIKVLSNTITGGTPPYQVSINNEENYYARYLFENLYSALFTVSIKDKNNCVSKLGTINVKSGDCTYEHSFSPDDGEVWEIPTKEQTGKIKMYGKSGVLVYQEIFDFPGIYKWYGRTNSGNELPMGVYMFVLELEDEEILYGNVTIIR